VNSGTVETCAISGVSRSLARINPPKSRRIGVEVRDYRDIMAVTRRTGALGHLAQRIWAPWGSNPGHRD
jgi:hypothetical protein